MILNATEAVYQWLLFLVVKMEELFAIAVSFGKIVRNRGFSLSVLATTPFSFINIYLALKTSRNNAVVDLSESKNSEKRVIKEADFQNFFGNL